MTSLAGESFDYCVRGSRTGVDGQGASGKYFGPKSGRIDLKSVDQWLQSPGSPRRHLTVNAGHDIHWDARLLGVDRYRARDVGCISAPLEAPLVQGVESDPCP